MANQSLVRDALSFARELLAEDRAALSGREPLERYDAAIRQCDIALREGGALYTTYEVLDAAQRVLGVTKEQANELIRALREGVQPIQEVI